MINVTICKLLNPGHITETSFETWLSLIYHGYMLGLLIYEKNDLSTKPG